MFKNNTFVGLALEGDYIRVAQIRKQGGRIIVVKLDRYELAESVVTGTAEKETEAKSAFQTSETTQESTSRDEVFGFEELETASETNNGNDNGSVDFEELEAMAEDQSSELESIDMVDEASNREVSSNPVLLYDILMDIDPNSAQVGLNIPAGETIFQFMRDRDYNKVESDDLTENMEAKLKSIYGQSKTSDYYGYEVREDGSLVLASVENESPLLTIADETRAIYNGNFKIKAIYPDEVALVGFLKVNYELEPSQVTAILQFTDTSCRVVLMQGNNVWRVLPLIERGDRKAHFFNNIFSKLLFLLDTDKIPSLDQIIIANNSLAEEALPFFEQNFPDANVEKFSYRDEAVGTGDYEMSTLQPFTTAIAVAWGAAEADAGNMLELSFMPSYVSERQKIFKLQWHGIILLVLIFLSIPTINYFYQKNADQIESLSSELKLTEGQIQQIEPVVQSTNEVAQKLSLLTSKLALMDSLSTGSKEWSTKLNILDRGMSRIPNSWLTSLSHTPKGTFIEGYTRYRNRVPAIVDLFAAATLLNVNIENVREKQLFKFSIIVQHFTDDSSRYSPQKSAKIEQLLNN